LKHVAADLGVPMSTINSWELGRRFPSGKQFDRISEYTGLPPCRLFCALAAKCARGHCRLKKSPPQ
jgi:transcriptional regulator with XRE-family HTH domain